jgi:hypothetical protein
MKYRFLFISFLLLNFSGTGFAVEIAPRISDREIVEKLAVLEKGQAALGQRLTDLRSEMKAGNEAIRSEMKAGNEAIRSEMKAGDEAIRSEMKTGDEAIRSEMKSGYEALSKRIDDLHSTMLAMFAALITLIVALFAYIAWDRRTMLKPVVERVDHLERVVMRDLDLDNKDGSVLVRLVHAMRELAKDDEKVATVLRNFSLL